MVDGGNFDGAKAYKDAKALNMMTVTELHRRFHDESGITFSSMYPVRSAAPLRAPAPFSPLSPRLPFSPPLSPFPFPGLHR